MKIGDHLVSPRCGYTHHGLYIGNGSVIHYGGFAKTKVDGVIAITSLREFCQNKSVRIRRHKTRLFTPEESVKRAHTRLDENWYNILINNCEHFVTWCIYGLPISRQVNHLILSAVGYKVLAKTTTAKAISSTPLGSTLRTAIRIKKTAQVARLATSAMSSSLLSSGTATGLTSLASGLGGGTASGLLAGAVSIVSPIAPLAAAVALGCLIDYGIRKLFK